MMESSTEPPPRDILDSSSDLHLPVFRIRQSLGASSERITL